VTKKAENRQIGKASTPIATKKRSAPLGKPKTRPAPEGREAVLISGNEACVEGALAAGLGFFAGYPITPATEISEALSMRLPAVGGRFIQMEDEIASMAAVIGASIAGLK